MHCLDFFLHLFEFVPGLLNQTCPRNTISRGINASVQHEIVRLCSRRHVDTVEIAVLFGILVDERLALGLRQERPPHGDLLGAPRGVGVICQARRGRVSSLGHSVLSIGQSLVSGPYSILRLGRNRDRANYKDQLIYILKYTPYHQ